MVEEYSEEEEDSSPILHEVIHEVVENQIRDGDPKETKETLERLMDQGYSRHEAIHKIGTVVVEEIYTVLKRKEKFNEERYVKKLLALR
jgi:methanogenic corrinoid protein MtbC1